MLNLDEVYFRKRNYWSAGSITLMAVTRGGSLVALKTRLFLRFQIFHNPYDGGAYHEVHRAEHKSQPSKAKNIGRVLPSTVKEFEHIHSI
jgi:hypothetical protein